MTALLIGLGAFGVSLGVAVVVGHIIRAGDDTRPWPHAADDPP